MQDLPTIDINLLNQRLLKKASDLLYTNAQLELLAEALRDERDLYERQLAELQELLTTPQQADDQTD